MIKSKIILLTGSEGFLGKAIIKKLLKNNKKIISIDKIKQKKKTLKKIDYYCCDFNDSEKLRDVISVIKKKYKKIDIIINNAALTTNIYSLRKNKFIIDNFDESVKVNLNSAYYISMQLKPCLNRSSAPVILNVASIYSIIAPDLNLYKNTNIKISAGYNVSKAGLVNLTKWLASYLAPKIRVNAISPGGILRGQDSKFVKNYKKKTLLNRMAKENDIINSIEFLISENSSYITGHNLVIDGGFSIK